VGELLAGPPGWGEGGYDHGEGVKQDYQAAAQGDIENTSNYNKDVDKVLGKICSE